MAWVNYLLQTAGGANGLPARTDPGNDPLFTIIATILFIAVSLGGGVLAFKLQNRRKPDPDH